MTYHLRIALFSAVLAAAFGCHHEPTGPSASTPDSAASAAIPWAQLSGRIAYTHPCGDVSVCIELIDVPTRTVRRIKQLNGNPMIAGIAWSADRSAILYSRFNFDLSPGASPWWRIESVSVETGVVGQVVGGPNSYVNYPAVSRDGRVAYVRITSAFGYTVCVLDELCIPTNFAYRFSAPAWAPDGSLLAYVAEEPSGGLAIYSATPNGGSPRVLVAGDEFKGQIIQNLAYTPDGSRLRFSTTALTGVNREVLWTVKSDGTDRRALSGSIAQPAWSRDGTRLLGITPEGASWSLNLYSADATQPVAVLKGLDFSTILAWAP